MTDYGKHLLQFQNKECAQRARLYIEKHTNIRVARFYTQLGFASKKSRDKIAKWLLDEGYVCIIPR